MCFCKCKQGLAPNRCPQDKGKLITTDMPLLHTKLTAQYRSLSLHADSNSHSTLTQLSVQLFDHVQHLSRLTATVVLRNVIAICREDYCGWHYWGVSSLAKEQATKFGGGGQTGFCRHTLQCTAASDSKCVANKKRCDGNVDNPCLSLCACESIGHTAWLRVSFDAAAVVVYCCNSCNNNLVHTCTCNLYF